MGWWDERAARLQDMTRASEGDGSKPDYDEETVRRSIIHTREDLILAVSLLSSANAQLRVIRICAILLVLMVGAILIRH